MNTVSMWLPTIPLTLIDVVNRVAAATGSMRYAELSEHADYNGHRISVHFNEYRGYWITEYFWAGRQVIMRGSLVDCLRAGVDEHKRGDRGCSVVATVPADQVALAESMGYVPHSKEAEDAVTEADPRFAEVAQAWWNETKFGVPATGLLLQSKDVAEYKVKLDQAFRALREDRLTRGEQLFPA